MDGWWRRDPRHLLYMLREGTSVFVGAYAVVLVWGLTALASGPEAWAGWVAAMGRPGALLFHLLVLVAACWHTVTWFAVAPKTMPPLKVGGRPVPDRVLVRAQYVVAGLVSAVILLAAGAAP
jgi:fumarate reductase subunit C